eukprot:403366097
MSVAQNIIHQSLIKTFSISQAELRKMVVSQGDYGNIAQKLFTEKNQQKLQQKQQQEKNNISQNTLTLEDVVKVFVQLNDIKGEDSIIGKISEISELLNKCQNEIEIKFIVRSLDKGLRIGISRPSVEACLLKLLNEGEINNEFVDEYENTIFGYKIYNNSSFGDQGLDINSEEIQDSEIKPKQTGKLLPTNVPLKPMLGRPAKDFEEVLKLTSKFRKNQDDYLLAEYKYDGERTQIHFDGEKVMMYSRNFDTQNQKFWRLNELLTTYFIERKRLGLIDRCILDGEVVYVDNKTNKYLPFQNIERTLQMQSEDPLAQIEVDQLKEISTRPCVVLFDVLALNQNDCITENILKRKEILKETFSDEPDLLQLGKYHVLSLDDPLYDREEKNDIEPLKQKKKASKKQDEEVIVKKTMLETYPHLLVVMLKVNELMIQSLNNDCEGLIFKSANDNTYYDISGKRSQQWVKLKHKLNDNKGDMRDTLDLIPIGAYYGLGRRTGTFGAYLIGAYNREYKNFEAVCKLGTGFKDSDLKLLHERVTPLLMEDKPTTFRVSSTIKPDYWINPKYVWEIGADQFSLSKTYTIGKGTLKDMNGVLLQDAGLSLRFPKFIRERPDKEIKLEIKKDKTDHFYVQDQEIGTEVGEILRMYKMDIESMQKIKDSDTK